MTFLSVSLFALILLVNLVKNLSRINQMPLYDLISIKIIESPIASVKRKYDA